MEGGGKAVRHATYLINRIGTRSLLGKMLYEALREKKPNLQHLRFLNVSVVRELSLQGEKSLMIDLELWYISELSPALNLIVCSTLLKTG